MSLNSFPFLSIERQEGIRRSGGSQSSAAGGRCDARRLGRLRHQWQSRLAAVRSETKGNDAVRYHLGAGGRSMRCGACAVGGSTLAFVRIDRNGRSLWLPLILHPPRHVNGVGVCQHRLNALLLEKRYERKHRVPVMASGHQTPNAPTH